MGFEKGDEYFFKQMGKGMLCTYALFGAAWLWNETSPLGWWTLKPRPKVRHRAKYKHAFTGFLPCCIYFMHFR